MDPKRKERKPLPKWKTPLNFKVKRKFTPKEGITGPLGFLNPKLEKKMGKPKF